MHRFTAQAGEIHPAVGRPREQGLGIFVREKRRSQYSNRRGRLWVQTSAVAAASRSKRQSESVNQIHSPRAARTARLIIAPLFLDNDAGTTISRSRM